MIKAHAPSRMDDFQARFSSRWAGVSIPVSDSTRALRFLASHQPPMPAISPPATIRDAAIWCGKADRKKGLRKIEPKLSSSARPLR